MSNRQEKSRRYIIAGLCGVAILVRMIWPSVKFDEISMFLFILGGLALLIPDIGQILGKIRKIKTPVLEIEIEKLVDKAERIEKEIETASTDPYSIRDLRPIFRHDISRFIAQPRGGLVEIAAKIESAAWDLAESYNIPRTHSLISPVMVASELAKRELLPKETPALIKGFWTVRNQAVHAKDFEITQEHLYELLDLGIRILRLLSLRRNYVEFARRQVRSSDEADVIVGANILSQQGEPADKHLLQETLKREGLSGEVRETLERAIRDLEKKERNDVEY